MSSPPRRLLRIGPPGNTLIRLYETPANFQEPYVALSYCWGQSATLKTTSSNMQSLARGFDLARLPAAIRDAVRIAQDLGLGYIWIDALCIVQDSRRDWEEQSARMCAVYEQAHLTIAASSSGAADVSFADHAARPQTFRYRVVPPSPDDEDEDVVILAARAECTSGHHYNPTGRVLAPPEPILTRGWTLQESILASRCVAYSTDELQWRCREASACECEMPADFRRDVLVRGSDEEGEEGEAGGSSSSSLWNQVVVSILVSFFAEQYSQRQLSFPGDKLPALSGICQLIGGRQTGSGSSSRYLAGLWEDGLPCCLLWERATGVEGSDAALPAQYRAPSWSWASVDAPVYPFVDLLNVYGSARVVRSAVLLAGADPFGQVKPGSSITVAGRLLGDVKVYEVEAEFATYRVRPRDMRDEEIVADGPLEAFCFRDAEGRVRRSVRRSVTTAAATTTSRDVDTDTGREGLVDGGLKEGGGSTVFLFLTARRRYKPNDFTTYYFLVLGVSPEDRGAYERLGTIGMGFRHHEFDDVAEQTITIL
ncbi:heterokaryon incompatibility protein-domain-containing protein [Hypoxylon rubiginosum]|uniref:Heterokaryon incompatibility protein-domain-containing protein n=1 Tax=Hypoxylon rubiginosum TaxID=110542 RepID=A0ACB9Z037_9PEZI|nr:heterokaryon incompatibility protein-domain-containing protein [Hypoxylon rubiginosum]